MLKLEDLYQIYDQYRDDLKIKVADFYLGDKHFDFNTKSAILGVVNLSRDSWYRESVCLSSEQAIRRGIVLNAQGADIVDIGAESTLEKAERVADLQQNSKLLPVLKALHQAGILTSVEPITPRWLGNA